MRTTPATASLSVATRCRTGAVEYSVRSVVWAARAVSATPIRKITVSDQAASALRDRCGRTGLVGDGLTWVRIASWGKRCGRNFRRAANLISLLPREVSRIRRAMLVRLALEIAGPRRTASHDDTSGGCARRCAIGRAQRLRYRKPSRDYEQTAVSPRLCPATLP